MRKTLLILFLFISTTSAYSQFFIAGGHLNGGFPISRLKMEVDRFVFPTISGILLYEFYNQPYQIGLEFGYGVYGSKLEKRNDLYPGYNDTYRLRRNNNYASGMAVFRYLPSKTSKLTPFIEIQVGANYLYSRYKIRPSIFEEVVEASKDMEDWGLAYKLGGGIQFPIRGLDGGKIELRMAYQDGNSMRFLTKGDVIYLPNKGNGEFEYSPRQSPLQLITTSVGIVVYDLFY